MSELFTFKNTGYNLRGGNKLKSNTVKTICYGTESISYLTPKVWEQVPDEIKNSRSLNISKNQNMDPKFMPMQNLQNLYSKFRLHKLSVCFMLVYDLWLIL